MKVNLFINIIEKEKQVISLSQNFKNVINNKFYPKTPSPMPPIEENTKFSVRKKSFQDTNSNLSSNSVLLNNENSNYSTTSNNVLLEKKFNILKTQYRSNMKSKDNDVYFKVDCEKSNDKIIVINKISKSADKSLNKSDLSDEEVLVYNTPTRKSDNFKFNTKSPLGNTKAKNLMNIFMQIKEER